MHRIYKWILACVKQLPMALIVAKLPFPYNFAAPLVCASGKTVYVFATGKERSSIVTYYFKTISRTFFGLSIRRFIESSARYAVGEGLGVSDDVLEAVGWVLIIMCVLLDAFD